MSAEWMKALKEKCFAAWSMAKMVAQNRECSAMTDVAHGPMMPLRLVRNQVDEVWVETNGFSQSAHMVGFAKVPAGGAHQTRIGRYGSWLADSKAWYSGTMTLFGLVLVHRADLKPQDLELVALHVLDAQGWQDFVNTFAPKFPGLFPKDVKVTAGCGGLRVREEDAPELQVGHGLCLPAWHRADGLG